ncbi:diguanylate cyclase [Gemmatimonadota bacterium]
MDFSDKKTIWKPFLVNISLVILLFILGIFIGLMIRNKQLIYQEVLTRAQANFQNIVLTRHWNAEYGGVYVEKREGVESNPYLKNPDIHTEDGKVYTKKNPALMTREISEIAEKDGMFTFHITSLKPINPGNTPDEFETRALKAFEQGVPEVFTKIKRAGATDFRYMAPLVTEEGCLQCHAEQGYRLGDIRGGISVRFDITEIENSLAENRYIIVFLGILTAAIILGILYVFVFKLMKKLDVAHSKLEELAVTDELTGLWNRRMLFDSLAREVERSRRYGSPLGCLLIDIDFFKKCNDTYGHQTGDLVLKELGRLLKEICRESDMPARYGGEEFMLLLMETDLSGSRAMAEKVRLTVERHEFKCVQGNEIEITVSIGVSSYGTACSAKGAGMEELIAAADLALYGAKQAGRNQVEFSN